MKKQQITHIFTDMDGTLLNSQGFVSHRNARLIREAGLPITLVSARAPMEMKETVQQLGLKGPHVAFNGALVYEFDGDKIHPLHVHLLFHQTVTELLTKIRQMFPEVSMSYYDINHWYCDRIDDGIRFQHVLTTQVPTMIHDEKHFLTGSEFVFKVMLITFDESEMLRLQTFLKKLDMSEIVFHRSGAYHLELTSRLAQKSFGIDYICRREGLHPSEIAAFGDGANDIAMFKRVGFPIAMANACQALKAYAVQVTKTNDQDGVGIGIHRYMLC